MITKRTQELKQGEKFFTSGDWRTMPGYWEVLEPVDEYGQIKCKSLPPSHEDVSYFHSNVSVSLEWRDE